MSDQFDSLENLLHTMTPDIHRILKTAVELGRWENGDKLSEEQRAQCLQAVIAYDEAFLAPEQRVGYLERPAGSCGKQTDGGEGQDG